MGLCDSWDAHLLMQAIFPLPPKKLVGGCNPSEKYSSNWIIFPSNGEHSKKYLSCHHLTKRSLVVFFWNFVQSFQESPIGELVVAENATPEVKAPSEVSGLISLVTWGLGWCWCGRPNNGEGEGLVPWYLVTGYPKHEELPSRELTYPTWGKGKLSSNMPGGGGKPPFSWWWHDWLSGVNNHVDSRTKKNFSWDHGFKRMTYTIRMI